MTLQKIPNFDSKFSTFFLFFLENVMWAELRIQCSSVEFKDREKNVSNNPHVFISVRSHLRSESHLTVWGLLVGY